MYRPSANPPQTAWARHLDQVLRDREWSKVRFFEEVGPALGYASKSRSALLPLLVDKNPTEAQAAILREMFGDPPADLASEPADATDTPDPVIAAMDRQTAAIEANTAMLERVLMALAPSPPDPLTEEDVPEMMEGERRLVGSRSLPRTPDRRRHAADRPGAAREVETA